MSEWNAETAEWYAANYGEHATNRLAIDAIDFAADADLLDVGCGTGAALRHAASRTSGALVGVDPVPRMVEIATDRALGHDPRLRFLVGTAGALPVEDDGFDVVLAFDSLDHWPDPTRGLAEVRRVLRSSGRLVVVKDTEVPPTHDLRSLAAAAGFSVLREEDRSMDDVRFTLHELRA